MDLITSKINNTKKAGLKNVKIGNVHLLV